MAEGMRADGVILTSDGWGNSGVDYTNCVEELGEMGIPMSGSTSAVLWLLLWLKMSICKNTTMIFFGKFPVAPYKTWFVDHKNRKTQSLQLFHQTINKSQYIP
mgnify:CR=1 FL=1